MHISRIEENWETLSLELEKWTICHHIAHNLFENLNVSTDLIILRYNEWIIYWDVKHNKLNWIKIWSQISPVEKIWDSIRFGIEIVREWKTELEHWYLEVTKNLITLKFNN